MAVKRFDPSCPCTGSCFSGSIDQLQAILLTLMVF